MANIVPNGEATQFKTGEKQVEIARQGGIASGEAKRRKKSLRQKAELLMSLPIKDKADLKKIKEMGIDNEEIDVQMATLIHMYNIIKKENFNSVGAFNSLKDLVDSEKENNSTAQPVLNINIQTNEKLKEAFYEKENQE